MSNPQIALTYAALAAVLFAVVVLIRYLLARTRTQETP